MNFLKMLKFLDLCKKDCFFSTTRHTTPMLYYSDACFMKKVKTEKCASQKNSGDFEKKVFCVVETIF